MRLRSLLPLAPLLLAASTSHAAPPTVCGTVPAITAHRVACTTEPAPAAPIITSRSAPRGQLGLRVIGQGGLCDAQWSVTVTGTVLAIDASMNVDAPSLCGTCTVDLRVTGVSRGDHTLSLAGTTFHARAR